MENYYPVRKFSGVEGTKDATTDLDETTHNLKSVRHIQRFNVTDPATVYTLKYRQVKNCVVMTVCLSTLYRLEGRLFSDKFLSTCYEYRLL